MERSIAPDEGITLTPANTTRLIAEAAARQVVLEHIRLCPFAGLDIEKRLRSIELNFAKLIAFGIGSGILGGTVGASFIRLLVP